MKPLDEIGFSEFKRWISRTSLNINDWFFTQSRTAYYADYRPKYPDHTAADFTVCLNFGVVRGRLTIYAHDGSLVPTIKYYRNMEELMKVLRNERRTE